jgi:hypothetical protein
MRARAYLRNGAKTEMISYQTDRTTKRNVNFLLAATACIFLLSDCGFTVFNTRMCVLEGMHSRVCC